MAETCKTCRWWQRDADNGGMVALDGTCLRYPPTPVTGRRPRTRDDDRCGEHSPKPWRAATMSTEDVASRPVGGRVVAEAC